MKLVTFKENNKTSIAVEKEDGRFYKVKTQGGISDVINGLANGEALALEDAALTNLRPALPADESAKIICVGLNYMDHAIEGNQQVPEHAVFFIRYLSSFVTDGEDVIAPKVSNRFDYEAELAVMIGKGGRYIAKEKAEEHIFGYLIGMDGSVRDYQKRTPQWTLGKNFEKSGVLGNVIISKDEMPSIKKGVQVQAKLNDEILQDGNTKDMIFDLGTIIATLSEAIELKAGDIILTGTPAGVGFARKPPIYLQNNDELEIIIEGIGSIKNKIKKEEV